MPSIQIKRGLEAAVKAYALKAGEFGFATDTSVLYIGTNGTAAGVMPIKAVANGGAATTAATLATARKIGLTGEIEGVGVAFDGSKDITISTTITDGSVDKANLDADLQAAIDAAGTALQKDDITEGATNGTIAVSGTDVKVHGLGSAAYTDADAYDVAGAADGVKAAVVNTLTAADNSVTVGGTTTEKTVAVKLDPAASNKLTLSEAGLKVEVPAAAEYTIVKAETATEGYFATYTLTKDGVQAGAAIDIPKDYLVKSASIKTSTGEDDPSGFAQGVKYIDFVINTKVGTGNEDHIYLNVQDLVDVYTGSTGDIVSITIGEDNSIKASVGDGTITKVKLAEAVQTSLGLADTALQVADVAEGATNGTIKVRDGEVAVHGLGTAAYENKTAFDAAGEAAKVLGADGDADTKATVYGARALAQKGVDAAAAAEAVADGKVASVKAADKSIVVGGTTVAPTVKVGVSTTAGNALALDENGLYVATPTSMAAGQGIDITGNTISAKVVGGNGLSLTDNGITMAIATDATPGAVKADGTTIVNTAGVISVNNIDCGEIG